MFNSQPEECGDTTADTGNRQNSFPRHKLKARCLITFFCVGVRVCACVCVILQRKPTCIRARLHYYCIFKADSCFSTFPLAVVFIALWPLTSVLRPHACSLKHLSSTDSLQQHTFTQFCGFRVVYPMRFLSLVSRWVTKIEIYFTVQVIQWNGDNESHMIA